jgi:predicted NUDIX family NTP pyrophosphohydrolase
VLLWRRRDGRLEVLLGHPGGPLFSRKDEGVWTLLKGEIEPGEDPYAVARREFEEETGHRPPDGAPLDLGKIRQKGGKIVVAWALEGDLDPSAARSNTFEMEWPPHSGRVSEFPEIDRVEWFDLTTAREKINAGQVPLLERLEEAAGD